MKAYGITYTVGASGYCRDAVVDASNLQFAINKLARMHRVDSTQITVHKSRIIGYF